MTVLSLTKAATLVLAIAGPAAAESLGVGDLSDVQMSDIVYGEEVAELRIFNKMVPTAEADPIKMAEERYTLKEYGEVTLHVSSTLGDGCSSGMCPDTYTVVDHPADVIPVPRSLTLPELESGAIKFFLIETLQLG